MSKIAITRHPRADGDSLLAAHSRLQARRKKHKSLEPQRDKASLCQHSCRLS